MASSVCSSSCIANIKISRVSVLDIINNDKNEWNYVIDVLWSDFRGHKIHRNYDEIVNLHTKTRKSVAACATLKENYLKAFPKVPARGFFTRNGIKLYVQNQLNVHNFFRFLIHLPSQVSSLPEVLDFFERRNSDPDIGVGLSFSKSSMSLQSGILDSRGRLLSTDSGICKSDIIETISSSLSAYDSASAVSGYSSDGSSVKSEFENRPISPPTFLPVKSCFESDDEDSWSTEYQRMLEDVSAFEFHSLPRKEEAHKNVPESIKSLDTYEMDFDELFVDQELFKGTKSNFTKSRHKCDDHLKESEEILSPYTPNKIYFYLVHMSDDIVY